MSELTRLDLLEGDVDLELAHLWEDLAGIADENDRTIAVRIARAAWAAGHVYATVEPSRGAWLKSHGYRIPERRAA